MNERGGRPGIIFDLDGTLVDSLDDLVCSVNVVRASLGLVPCDRAAVASMVGDGAGALIARAVGHDGDAVHAEALARFEAHYAAHCTDRTRPFDGIGEMLDGLVAADCPLAVLSNKPDGFTRACCTALLSAWRFAAIVGERPGVPRKPAPHAAVQIAERMSRSPGSVIVVGDSPGDIACGRSAGMRTVGVAWGYRTVEALRAAGADAVIDTPESLTAQFCAGLVGQG